MTSTMKKLKVKMERGNDDEDDEDAQEPSFRSLVPGTITPSSTSPSLFPYLSPMPPCPFSCVHGMKHQILEQEDQSPHPVMLEEMD